MDVQMEVAFRPRPRYLLRARIHQAGFWTLRQFSEKIGVDVARLSRVLSAWEQPSPKMQRLIAQELGITLKEFKELL